MERGINYNILSRAFNSNEGFASCIFVCILAIIIYKWIAKTKNNGKVFLRTLPGLKVTPYSPYGNLNHMRLERLKQLGMPPATYVAEIVLGHALLFRNEGIFRFLMAYQQYVFLTKPEYVQELLNSTTFLKKGKLYDMAHPWVGTGLLTSHGLKWKTRRKLLTPSFHFDILKDFVPIFDDQSKVIVDILKENVHQDWVDITELITLCSLDIICETTLGTHVNAQRNSSSEYVQAVSNATRMLATRAMYPMYYIPAIFWMSSLGQKFRKQVECLHNFTQKVIQEKKHAKILTEDKFRNPTAQEPIIDPCKKKRKALIDLLLDVHMNNPEFTEEDIREEIDTFAFEGHDTTSSGMSWALYLIGLYPEVQSKLCEELEAIFGDDHERPVMLEDLKEMTYLERVLKESLRLFPPVPFFVRSIHEDLNLYGYEIKKDSQIVISPIILHYNSEAFPNPEKFDPDRFLPENCAGRHPFAYLPFSAGPRNCIGQRFAMMEEKVVICNVLRNFSVKSLEQRDKVWINPEIVLRSVHPLKMKFTPRY